MSLDQQKTTEQFEISWSELQRFLRGVIWRRRRVLTILPAVTFIIFLAAIFLYSPSYQGVVRVRLDPASNPMTAGAGSSRVQITDETVETEVSVLNSSAVSREVVKRLGLVDDPEFAPGAEGSGADSLDERINLTAENVRRRLSVRRDRKSYVLVVIFRAKGSRKAASIADAYAEAYLDARVDANRARAAQQAEFFEGRLEALAKEVNDSETALAEYRNKAGIIGGRGGATAVDRQITSLSTQLAIAESDAAEKQSRLDAAERQISENGIASVTEVRNSPVVRDLRRQKAEVLRGADDVFTRYGERHPQSVRAREQLASLENQIADEARRVIQSLRSDVAAARARVERLTGSMDELGQRQGRNSAAIATSEVLNRRAEAARAAYDRIASMSLESKQAIHNSIGEASIIERADPTAPPATPSRALLTVFAGFSSVLIAIGSAGAMEYFAPGIRSARAFERRYGLRVLGTQPQIDTSKNPANEIIKNPSSLYSEIHRNIRTSLSSIPSRHNSGTKVFGVTSAFPGEGKTTLALSFARSVASTQTSTLLIDGDVMTAGLSIRLRSKRPDGLLQVFEGQAALADAVVVDRVPDLHVLRITRSDFNLESSKFSDLWQGMLERAREEYSMVIVDLPPIIGISQTRLLMGMVDGVILAVKWGATPPSAVEMALSVMREDDAPAAGAVLTNVHPSAVSDGLYQSSKYSAYFRT